MQPAGATLTQDKWNSVLQGSIPTTGANSTCAQGQLSDPYAELDRLRRLRVDFRESIADLAQDLLDKISAAARELAVNNVEHICPGGEVAVRPDGVFRSEVGHAKAVAEASILHNGARTGAVSTRCLAVGEAFELPKERPMAFFAYYTSDKSWIGVPHIQVWPDTPADRCALQCAFQERLPGA